MARKKVWAPINVAGARREEKLMITIGRRSQVSIDACSIAIRARGLASKHPEMNGRAEAVIAGP
jgi:hypothetical protein